MFTAYIILTSLWILSAATGFAQEIGTFNETNLIVCSLLARSDGIDQVRQLSIEFRTSHANESALIGLLNSDGELFEVLVADNSQLTVRLAWLAGENSSDDIIKNEDAHFFLTTQNLTLAAENVSIGEWHHLFVELSNNSVLLDNLLLGRLPAKFSARFAWNNTAEFSVGGGFRGCLANASLDGDARVPLHSESELLNRTGRFVALNFSASVLPSGGSTCRQAPCKCLPNGACLYERWDKLVKCNCTRGYEGEKCEREWNTCMHLDDREGCLNGGECKNRLGPSNYGCICAGPFVGSRCQSFNHCQDPITCQNGANCTLVENPAGAEIDYTCTCTKAYTGRNCTVPIIQPETGINMDIIVGATVGVIALLLLLIAALVAVKVIRDRRRDFGTYLPSHREARNIQNGDQAMMGMGPVLRPPKEERLI